MAKVVLEVEMHWEPEHDEEKFSDHAEMLAKDIKEGYRHMWGVTKVTVVETKG